MASPRNVKTATRILPLAVRPIVFTRSSPPSIWISSIIALGSRMVCSTSCGSTLCRTRWRTLASSQSNIASSTTYCNNTVNTPCETAQSAQVFKESPAKAHILMAVQQHMESARDHSKGEGQPESDDGNRPYDHNDPREASSDFGCFVTIPAAFRSGQSFSDRFGEQWLFRNFLHPHRCRSNPPVAARVSSAVAQTIDSLCPFLSPTTDPTRGHFSRSILTAEGYETRTGIFDQF
jgi:hypothetical protein